MSSAALVVGVALPASAQSGGEFGSRGETVFGVERIFGFHHTDFGDESIEGFAYDPFLWSSLAVHHVGSSGLSIGALFGATYLHVPAKNADAKDNSRTFVQLRPRIGYAGWVKQGFGYWVRGGPSAFLNVDHDQSETHYSLSVGLEAYVVLRAARHAAFLVGPHYEPKLFADEDGGDGKNDYRIGSYGLTVGMMGEFF